MLYVTSKKTIEKEDEKYKLRENNIAFQQPGSCE